MTDPKDRLLQDKDRLLQDMEWECAEATALALGLEERVGRLMAEVEAYKRAKAENDERFQLELGTARAEVEELKNTRRRCHALLQGAMSALPPDYPEAPEVWAELEDCAEHACTRQCDEERERLEASLSEAEGLIRELADHLDEGITFTNPSDPSDGAPEPASAWDYDGWALLGLARAFLARRDGK